MNAFVVYETDLETESIKGNLLYSFQYENPTIEELKQIVKVLKKEYHTENVVILNIIPLKTIEK